MLRNLPNPVNAAILIFHIRINAFCHRVVDDGCALFFEQGNELLFFGYLSVDF